MLGYLEKGIQTPMARGWSTKFISMIKWIRTSRLSKKNSLYVPWKQVRDRPDVAPHESAEANRIKRDF